jgi:hypothetical protein
MSPFAAQLVSRAALLREVVRGVVRRMAATASTEKAGLSLSIGMGPVTLRVRRRTCIDLARSFESCMQRNIS